MHASPESGPIEIALNHWPVTAVEPTTLILFWSGDAPPGREEVIKRLISRGATIDDDAEAHVPAAAGLAWHIAMVPPDAPELIHIWCESNPDENNLGDATLDACPWIIGLQTILNADDPAGTYDRLLQWSLDVAPNTPGVLDANTALCHERRTIEQFRIDEAPPATDWLWRVDGIAGASTGSGRFDRDATVQLRTAGLNRCARPELAVGDVPQNLVDAAVTLLNVLADHFIDHPPPPPDTPFAVGPEIHVRLQPAGAFPFAGKQLEINTEKPSIAMVVDAETDEAARCPVSVLEKIAEGSAPLLISMRATARQAALARRQWPVLEEMYHENPAHRYFVKAAVDLTGNPGDSDREREHIWFQISSIADGKARARPLRRGPISANVVADEESVIDPAGITDWRIESQSGVIGPADVQQLDTKIP